MGPPEAAPVCRFSDGFRRRRSRRSRRPLILSHARRPSCETVDCGGICVAGVGSESPRTPLSTRYKPTGNGEPQFVFALPRCEYFRRQDKIIEGPERAAAFDPDITGSQAIAQRHHDRNLVRIAGQRPETKLSCCEIGSGMARKGVSATNAQAS